YSAQGHRALWEEARKVLEPMLERAIALIDTLPENRESVTVREELARFLYLYGRRDAALVQFQRLEASRPRVVPADDPLGLRIRPRLALVLREHGRFAEAWPLLEQALAEALRPRIQVPERDDAIESPHRVGACFDCHVRNKVPKRNDAFEQR